jgi:hypothetical protein
MPELLHYRFSGSPFALRTDDVSIVIVPMVTPTTSGVAATGFL